MQLNPKPLVPAIVIGLDCITGLQTARILASHQIPVTGIATNPDHFCCRTKVCRQIVTADTNNPALIEVLKSLGLQMVSHIPPNAVSENKAWGVGHSNPRPTSYVLRFHPSPQLSSSEKAVLFPCTDTSVLLISRHRRQLAAWYRIMLPEPDVVEMLMDKIRFYSYAQEAGLPVPATYLIHNEREAREVANELAFPCILKPPFKSPLWQKNTRVKAFKAGSAQEFLDLYKRCCGWADVLMAQEWINGSDADLYSCNCYFDAASEPLVTFIARKIRQWPPETGTSCLGEEVCNDVVLAETMRLFRSVNFRGLGYVEMKRDARTGRHYIIEPNIGRPTGRSAIAEAGGVALLYTMYCEATGRPLPANRQQTYRGVKWIYWRHDIQSALYYWWRGDLSLQAWWQSWRGHKAAAVFSWRDPAPFWADLRQSVMNLWARRRGRRANAIVTDPVKSIDEVHT